MTSWFHVVFLLVWMLALLTYFSLNYLLHYFMISFRTYILPGLRVYLLVSYLLTSCFHVILTYFLTSWFHSLLSYFLTSWLPDFAACLFEYFLILYLHTRLQDFTCAFAYDCNFNYGFTYYCVTLLTALPTTFTTLQAISHMTMNLCTTLQLHLRLCLRLCGTDAEHMELLCETFRKHVDCFFLCDLSVWILS